MLKDSMEIRMKWESYAMPKRTRTCDEIFDQEGYFWTLFSLQYFSQQIDFIFFFSFPFGSRVNWTLIHVHSYRKAKKQDSQNKCW